MEKSVEKEVVMEVPVVKIVETGVTRVPKTVEKEVVKEVPLGKVVEKMVHKEVTKIVEKGAIEEFRSRGSRRRWPTRRCRRSRRRTW